ncbi:armadillo-like helical domain containing protein 1 [Pycnococcus provasolii]
MTSATQQDTNGLSVSHLDFAIAEVDGRRVPSTAIQRQKHNQLNKPIRVSANRWDVGGRIIRVKMLRDFLKFGLGKTAAEIDRYCDNAASLFFARVNAYLRLTYLTNFEMSLQLNVVGIFLHAPGGERFVAQFIECGGVTTLLDILSMSSVSDGDKFVALNHLKSIAERGWNYSRVINEQDGASIAVAYMLGTATEPGQVLISSLVVELASNDSRCRLAIIEQLLDATSATNPFAQLAAASAAHQLLVTSEDGVEPQTILRKAAVAAANLAATKLRKLERMAFELLTEVRRIQDGNLAIAQSLAEAIIDVGICDTTEFDELYAQASPGTENSTLNLDEEYEAHKAEMQRRAAAAHLLARHVEDVYTARDEEAINVLQSEETLLDVLSCMASKDMETKKAANSVLQALYEYARVTTQEVLKKLAGAEFFDNWVANSSGGSSFFEKMPEEHKETIYRIHHEQRALMRPPTR